MDVLTNLALPQSLEHFHLVVLLAALSAFVFLPYLAIAIGASIVVRFLSRSGRDNGNAASLQLARALAETTFASKSLVMYLGVIPGLSLVFSLSQILQRTPAVATSVAAVGFIFLTAGLFLMYAYRYTFRVQGLLEAYDALVHKHSGDIAGDVGAYQVSNRRSHVQFGRYGTIALLVAAFLYIAALTLASDPMLWSSVGSFLGVLLTWTVWLRYAAFLAFAVGVTGVGLLFIAFHWKKEDLGEDEMSVQLARRYGFILSVAGLISLPLTILTHVFFMPAAVLAGMLYGLVGLALFLFFLSAHFVYAFFRDNTPRSTAYAFFFFLLAGTSLIAVDFLAVGYATRHQADVLAVAHATATEELRSSLGVSIAEFTGEDIYNAKCSACHLFDQKKVGPPYWQTIPKYKDRRADMIAFVMNPVKIDPAYPPMPNQGLKPAEADSVVAYLFGMVARKAK